MAEEQSKFWKRLEIVAALLSALVAIGGLIYQFDVFSTEKTPPEAGVQADTSSVVQPRTPPSSNRPQYEASPFSGIWSVSKTNAGDPLDALTGPLQSEQWLINFDADTGELSVRRPSTNAYGEQVPVDMDVSNISYNGTELTFTIEESFLFGVMNSQTTTQYTLKPNGKNQLIGYWVSKMVMLDLGNQTLNQRGQVRMFRIRG